MADFEGTARNAVAPILSMKDTYQNPFLMWRSINTDWAAFFGLGVITALEAIAGTLATIGVIIMVVKLKSPYSDFQRGKSFAILGSIIAILIWGIGFMIFAGDWFMSWQSSDNPLSVQLGAMIYMLPCTLSLLLLIFHKE